MNSIKKSVIALAMVVALFGSVLALPATPASAFAGPDTAGCSGQWVTTVQINDTIAHWVHSYWRLHYTWCSTGTSFGHVFNYRQWHTVDHMDSIWNDEGIVENSGHYAWYGGNPRGMWMQHVKGKISSCFILICVYAYPWANVAVTRDGHVIQSHGVG